jgi:hypothetical protein
MLQESGAHIRPVKWEMGIPPFSQRGVMFGAAPCAFGMPAPNVLRRRCVTPAVAPNRPKKRSMPQHSVVGMTGHRRRSERTLQRSAPLRQRRDRPRCDTSESGDFAARRSRSLRSVAFQGCDDKPVS